jgi:hypothetical protein
MKGIRLASTALMWSSRLEGISSKPQGHRH